MDSAKTLIPHALAAINVSTVIALSGGYYFVRRGDRATHRKFMLAATALGVAFMVLYLIYHFGAGLAKFGGEGVIRPIYFTILITHILIAAVATPLVPLAVYRGLTDQIAAHRRIAKWAWKIWMFVALSGIVVYVMTIHLWPYQGVAP